MHSSQRCSPTWLIGAAKIEAYSRWTIRSHQLGGAVVESTVSVGGVCLWQPPGRRSPRTLGLRVLPETLRFVWALGPDAPRSLRGFTREERRREALVPGQRGFLVMLGVDPAVQRFGLGAALAPQGLARADADHVPTYLISNSRANVALYSQMGFRVVDRTDPAADRLGISTRRMLRPPH